MQMGDGERDMATTGNVARVLVADDDEGVRAFLVHVLSRAGFPCVEAADGDAVRALVRSGGVDLVITDVHMPGNEDFELLQLANGDEPLPFIVVSGDREPGVIVEAFRRAAVDFMTKPLEPTIVVERVKAALQKAQKLRALKKTRSDVEQWLTAASSLEHRADLSIESYMSQTFLLMAQLSSNLQAAVAAEKSVDLCAKVRCRRRVLYEEALHKAVETLEKTKGSFKSKDLGELRVHLEQVLGQS